MNKDCFGIEEIIEKYDIPSEKIEKYLKDNYSFIGRIDYIYGSGGETGETLYYTNKEKYLDELRESYRINRSLSFKVLKGNQKEVSICLERSLY